VNIEFLTLNLHFATFI